MWYIKFGVQKGRMLLVLPGRREVGGSKNVNRWSSKLGDSEAAQAVRIRGMEGYISQKSKYSNSSLANQMCNEAWRRPRLDIQIVYKT